MPYSIIRIGKNRYKVINTETGEVHAEGTSKAKAKAQIRVMQAAEHNPDWHPTGKKR